MPVLNGMTTEYDTDGGAFIINNILTQGVYTINDSLQPDVNLDLNLGTNGQIKFIVDGGGTDGDDSLNISSSSRLGVPTTNIYNFEASSGSEKAIALTPTDIHATVILGDAQLTRDSSRVYMDSVDKKLTLVSTDEVTVNSDLHTTGDVKIDGNIFTPDLNITKSYGDAELLGYSFRINENSRLLELVKYTENTDPNLSATQLVATFGKGHLFNDPTYSHNVYSTAIQEALNANPPNSNMGYMFKNNNSLYWGTEGLTQEYIGIGTSTPSCELEVVGKTRSTTLSDGTISITNGRILDAKSVMVDTSQGNGIIFDGISTGSDYAWDGHASNLFEIHKVPLSTFVDDLNLTVEGIKLETLFTASNTVWFDNEQSNIPLSSFSNDLALSSLTNDLALSSLTNDLALSSLTNDLALSSFSNDLELEAIPTWVESDQSSVQLSSFSNDLALSSFTNDLELEAIPTWVSTDQSTIHLSSFSNDLIVDPGPDLSVSGFVKSHLIPDVDNAYDLGSVDKKWRSMFVGANTIHVGSDVSLGSSGSGDSASFNITGGALVPDPTKGLSFADGSSMKSMKDAVTAVNKAGGGGSTSGGIFSDLSSEIKLNLGPTSSIIRLNGELIFSKNHQIYDHTGETLDTSLAIYEYNDRDVIPISSVGGFSTDSSTRMGTSSTSKVIFNGVLTENAYIVSTNQTDFNQLYPVHTINPKSTYFKRKMISDFNTFNNTSNPRTNLFMYHEDFTRLNNIETTKQISSTRMVVEFISYYDAPIFHSYFLDSTLTNKYLVPNNVADRKLAMYELDTNGSVYVKRVVSSVSEFGLFPRIQISEWNNSVNQPTFIEPIFSSTFGWGSGDTGDIETVFSKFKEDGWLLELYKLTYLYIKYGNAKQYAPNDDFLQNINTTFSNLTSDSLIFIEENNIDTLEVNTIVCFKQSVFDSIN
jgi:hypothetical protein